LTHQKCPDSSFVASNENARVRRVVRLWGLWAGLSPNDGIDVG
jgi:hypothetical protein